MNDDFLNIWVVVHDKATDSLKALSKHIKDADSMVNRLENSIGKLDNRQIRSLQSQLNMGKNLQENIKNTEKYTQRINEMSAARDKDAKASEQQTKAHTRMIDRALADDRKWSSDRRKLIEEAYKDDHNFTQRAIGDLKRLAQEHDRNVSSTGRLRNAFASLHTQVQKNNSGAGIFRQNFAGLRVGIAGLVAILPPAIGALVDLAGLLASVAAAASLAAAALGGALVASIAQAAPVIGLLVLAFKQLFDIIKLTSQQQKNAGTAAHDAAQKSLTLAQRLEQERQAHIALANAQKQLTIARRDALRNIQDLNKAEQDALSTSRRATLGLIGSQAALAGLVSGGGSALDVANAQLDVGDASRNVGTTRLAAGRASVDAARARRQGVSGNPQVIAAQQSITQQQHQLALDARAYAIEQNKVSAATDTYRQALAKLDPAQRRLFDAVVALRKEFTKDWKGITDPIINAFTGIVKGITKALKDPQIHAAFASLSGTIGSAITTSTSFFGTPEAKKLFLQVMADARQNLPLIARILRDISQLFLRIAVAAGPFVHVILKAIVKFFDDMTAKTANKTALASFFDVAFKAANAFWTVLTGILDIFVALGQGGGAKTGIELVGQLGKYLHNIADELKNNKAGTNSFFNDLGKTVGILGTIIDHVLRTLVKVEQTGAFDTLLKVVNTFLIPALDFVLVTLGKITNMLGQFALHHRGITEAALIITGVGLAAIKAAGLVSNVYETVKKVQQAYRILAGTQKAFELAEAGKAAAATTSAATIVAAEETVVVAEGEVAVAAETSWIAILGPVALVIAALAAVGVAVYLLDKKFHFLAPTFKWLKDTFFEVIHYIEKHWKGLLILLGGPIGLIIVEIITHFRTFKNIVEPMLKFIGNLIAWVYNHGLKQVLGGLNDIVKFLDGGSLDSAFKAVFNSVISVAKGALKVIQDIYGVISAIVGLVHSGNSGKTLPGGQLNPRNRSSLTSPLTTSGSTTSGGIYQQANNVGYDQGIDYKGSGPIPALGDSVVIRVDKNSSWPSLAHGRAGGGTVVAYKITSGPQKGRYVYVAENISTNVKVGQKLKAGETVAVAQGQWPYTESGFATSTGSPLAPRDSTSTGRAFGVAFGLPGMGSSGKPGAGNWKPQVRPASSSRGGHAATIWSALGQPDLLGQISTGIKLTVWDALDQIAMGFKHALGAKSPGYILMIKGITALDQLFTDKARTLTRLVAAQRHRIISNRYAVQGQGNSTVRDLGGPNADINDAKQNLTDLGIDRGSILDQLNDTAGALIQFQKELRKTPNNKKNQAKRQLLIATIKRYQDQQDALTGALDQNTIDLVNAQTAYIQAQVDQATHFADRMSNLYGIRIAIAQLTGIGKETIPELIGLQIQTLVNEKGPLQAALAQAEAVGNTALAQQIYDALQAIDQKIAETTQARFDAVVALIEDPSNRALAANDIAGRLNSLGGNSYNSLAGQGGILRARGGILQNEINGLRSITPENPAQAQQIADKIAELTAQLAENVDAIRQNSEDLKAAAVNRIVALGSFRSGVNSGVQGIINSLAAGSGTTDTVSLLRSLTAQQGNLTSTGSDLRGQLLSQYGINLSSDPNQLITQLTGTDWSAIEFGMDDTTKSTFETLINEIIGNTGAQIDNTTEIKKTTGMQNIQDWSSSLWSNFRDALFTGNNSVLGGIPQAAVGAHIIASGLVMAHAGETIVPAGVTKYQSGDSSISVHVDNRGSGDVDGLGLAKRIAYEMKSR